MSDASPPPDPSKQRIVYRLPGMDAVGVRRDLPFEGTDGNALALDVYHPPDSGDVRLPAVVFASGYPDPGMEQVLGFKLKQMGAYISWAELVAASGLAAITYTNTEPVADLGALLRHLRENAASLGLDSERIGLWACSGNVPNALWALMSERFACAALCYGFMLDLDGATGVADAAKTFFFANPCAGRSVSDLPDDLPLLIARAGADENPGLNDSIDRFAAEALARDLPVTVVNHAGAPHAFDLVDDSEATREVIRQIVAFLRFRLLG
jgi:dienelactone hydrolase